MKRNDTKTGRNDRGLLSTELAVIMPIMLLFALLGVYIVQAERHSSRAQSAADAAARAGSLMPDEVRARQAAQSAAEAVCNGTVVIADANFVYVEPVLEPFTPGWVAVGLTCTEPYRGFGLLTSKSSRTESGSSVSVLEYFRPRS